MSLSTRISPLDFVRTGPAQYINRKGTVLQAGKYIRPWGSRALVSGGKTALSTCEAHLQKSFQKAGIKSRRRVFIGESSPRNIAGIKAMAEDFRADVIVGVGGGRSLDA